LPIILSTDVLIERLSDFENIVSRWNQWWISNPQGPNQTLDHVLLSNEEADQLNPRINLPRLAGYCHLKQGPKKNRLLGPVILSINWMNAHYWNAFLYSRTDHVCSCSFSGFVHKSNPGIRPSTWQIPRVKQSRVLLHFTLKLKVLSWSGTNYRSTGNRELDFSLR